MRVAAVLLARGLLLAGPVVLAFHAGGFFDGPRDVALVVAAATLALLAAAGAPGAAWAHPATRVTLVAAWAYAAWIALSGRWAPVPALAGDDAERAVLYAAVLTAASVAFADRRAVAVLEALAAAGIVVVVAYGLSGRLLPGLVPQHPQSTAVGRLDQPLTYWNAMGALAAIGIVLCARIAGDAGRAAALRAAAAGAAVPLGMGCYLSFSRGALAALAAGLATAVVLAPTRSQLRAAVHVVAAAAAGALAGVATAPVRTLSGSMHQREGDGLLILVVTIGLIAASALATRFRVRPDRPLALPRSTPWLATAFVVALLVVPIVAAGGRQPAPATTGATSERLASLGSNRYAYWRVAAEAGLDHPLAGLGASGFRVAWLQHRTIGEPVRDAHSLEIETFAELGAAGLLLLAGVLGGAAVAARAAHARAGSLVAGPIAALVVWTFHSAIDWDWEMPALTLVAVVLAGAVIAQAGGVRAPPRSAAPRG